MSDKTEYSRMLIKRTAQTGVVPTSTSATTLNELTETDILVGEMYTNVADDRVFIRTQNNILEFSTTSYSGGSVNTEIDLGDWNMDTTSGVTISHSLSVTEWKGIRNVGLIIRNDADTEYYTIDSGASSTGGGFVNVGIEKFTSTDFHVFRVEDGSFDNTDFDSTSYNRGYITFTYIPD